MRGSGPRGLERRPTSDPGAPFAEGSGGGRDLFREKPIRKESDASIFLLSPSDGLKGTRLRGASDQAPPGMLRDQALRRRRGSVFPTRRLLAIQVGPPRHLRPTHPSLMWVDRGQDDETRIGQPSSTQMSANFSLEARRRQGGDRARRGGRRRTMVKSESGSNLFWQQQKAKASSPDSRSTPTSKITTAAAIVICGEL